MKANRYAVSKSFFRACVASLTGLVFFAGGRSFAFPPPIPTEKEAAQIIQFRQAEKKGDHSLDTEMIAVLQQNPPANPDVLMAAAHALARLADTDALPALEMTAQNKNVYPDVARSLKVQAARLQAESLGLEMPEGNAKAKAKVDIFLQLLNLTPQKINHDVAEYSNSKNTLFPVPLSLTAMGELADMIYHGAYQDYVALPVVQQIDFRLNSATALQMRLAALSHKDRIAAMVKDLSGDRNEYTDAEVRFAADEGVEAGQEAVAQLSRMAMHRESYTKKNFKNLFLLIHYTQPPDMKAVRTWYIADPDVGIAEDAYTYLQP